MHGDIKKAAPGGTESTRIQETKKALLSIPLTAGLQQKRATEKTRELADLSPRFQPAPPHTPAARGSCAAKPLILIAHLYFFMQRKARENSAFQRLRTSVLHDCLLNSPIRFHHITALKSTDECRILPDSVQHNLNPAQVRPCRWSGIFRLTAAAHAPGAPSPVGRH